jgi:hypothetical protein
MRSISWISILAGYFNYLTENLRIASLPNWQKEQILTLLPADVAIPKDNIDSVLSMYPNLPGKLASYAVQMILSGIGLNPEIVKTLVDTLPKIDRKLIGQISKLLSMEKELHDISMARKHLGLKDEDSIKDFVEKFSAIEKRSSELIKRLTETDEFLKWKMKKEKGKKKEA